MDHVYEEGTVVKLKSLDGQYVLGKAGKIQNEQRGGVSAFTPCDSDSYSSHNSRINSVKSMALAGADVVQKTFWEGAKVISYLPEFCEFTGSKVGLTTYSEDSWDLGRKECDEISSSWHNSLYNMAPHKAVFNSSELIMNIYQAISGVSGITKSITNIPKLFSGGFKVAGFANGALQADKVLNLNIAGIGKLGGSALLTDSSINNIVENSDKVETKEGKRNTRSENSLKKKLENRIDDQGNRVYSDEDIDAIINIRNSEYELTLENGEKMTIKRHGYQKKDAEGQSHHLNQDAAYREIIPKEEGLAIDAEGNVFIDKESAHYKAHETMEEFWDKYRKGGELYRAKPTVGEYNSALKDSMQNAGFSENDADIITEIAANQQRTYGLTESNEVPRIPGKINAIER